MSTARPRASRPALCIVTRQACADGNCPRLAGCAGAALRIRLILPSPSVRHETRAATRARAPHCPACRRCPVFHAIARGIARRACSQRISARENTHIPQSSSCRRIAENCSTILVGPAPGETNMTTLLQGLETSSRGNACLLPSVRSARRALCHRRRALRRIHLGPRRRHHQGRQPDHRLRPHLSALRLPGRGQARRLRRRFLAPAGRQAVIAARVRRHALSRPDPGHARAASIPWPRRCT